MQPTVFLVALLAAAVSAAPTPGNAVVNPNAVTGTKCGAKTAINDHNINVALLSICGGISGAITKCNGNPAKTTGASGDASFSLAAEAGATINVSKGRWEGCVRAARATCGDSPFTSTCIGGASKGNVQFSLSAV